MMQYFPLVSFEFQLVNPFSVVLECVYRTEFVTYFLNVNSLRVKCHIARRIPLFSEMFRAE